MPGIGYSAYYVKFTKFTPFFSPLRKLGLRNREVREIGHFKDERVRTYFFLVPTFSIDLIENEACHREEHPKISKFTKFDGYWFEHKGMVHF